MTNIHNFHDESNLVSYASSDSGAGSEYAAKRTDTLRVMTRFLQLAGDGIAFLFGDFNFRCDMKPAMHWLCNETVDGQLRAAGSSSNFRWVDVDEEEACKVCLRPAPEA